MPNKNSQTIGIQDLDKVKDWPPLMHLVLLNITLLHNGLFRPVYNAVSAMHYLTCCILHVL